MSIDTAIVQTASFIQSVLPWIPAENIVRGQTNDVPPPLPPSIVITEILQAQYTTTRTSLNNNGNEMTFTMPRRLDLQIDCYGPRAGEMAVVLTTLLRSFAATEFFADGYEPLYCSDPIQAPLITGEKQFETRWTLTFSMQYNSAIVLATESFNTVGETEAIPADIINPVE